MVHANFRAYLEDYLAKKYSYMIEGDSSEFTLLDKVHKGAPIRVIVSQDQKGVSLLVGKGKSTFNFESKDNEDREKVLSFIESILQGDVAEKHRVIFSSTKIGKETNYDLDLTSWRNNKYAKYPSKEARSNDI